MQALPPGLSSLCAHEYGRLRVLLFDPSLPAAFPRPLFRAVFFGMDSDESAALTTACTTLQYRVVTNLWAFYSYLSDMEHLDIQVCDAGGGARGMGRVALALRSSREVLSEGFTHGDIVGAGAQRCVLVDARGEVVGSVAVRIWTEFDRQLHEDIKELVNFNEMVVFEGISPISSETELPREPPQQLSIAGSQVSSHKVETGNKPSRIDTIFHELQSEIREPEDEDEQHRLIEEDIDKLIREMQSKPYDSSKYQQRQRQTADENTNFMNSGDNFNKISNTNSYNFSVGSNKARQTEASTKMDRTMSRPPLYSPMSKTLTQIQTRKTLVTTTPRIVKGQNLASREVPLNILNSHIDLIIHQLQFSLANSIPHTAFSGLVQACYSIKLYLNNDIDQYFVGQGIKQGEIIKFNQSLKLRNLGTLRSVRFTICDDYSRVECEGVFDLSRLYTSNKGVFIVSMMPAVAQPSATRTSVIVAESKLVEVSPLIRTLRIEAQLVEKVEIVQIYLKINKVSAPYTMLRYKIPLTKQTIEHMGAHHVNIFPHSSSPQVAEKLIIEFWRNEDNIGQSEISLKNIRSVNTGSLNSSIDPTYLYDGRKQIRNIFESDRVVGDFQLTLCFGTVKQMQSLILSAIELERQTVREPVRKVEATIDQRLGVIVNKKPVILNEMSVQVEIEPILNEASHEDMLRCVEPSFGEQSRISHASNNEFLEASIVSFSGKAPLEAPTPQKPAMKLLQSAKLQPLSQKIGETVTLNLHPLAQQLPRLKQLCKPHLLYNFITVDNLRSVLLPLGLTYKAFDMVLKTCLFPKQGMLNVNILYDLCASVQIEGTVNSTLIGDEMLIVNAMRLLYGNEGTRKSMLLEHDMDFREMGRIFESRGVKLALHEFHTLERFLKCYDSRQKAEELRQAVIMELEEEVVQQMKQGFYEQDILQQIYADESSMASLVSGSKMSEQEVEQKSEVSFRKQSALSHVSISSQQIPVTATKVVEKVQAKPAQQPVSTLSRARILINGAENVRQSAQCVFDDMPSNIWFKITVDNPVFQQVKLPILAKAAEFEGPVDLRDADGRIELAAEGRVLACAAFSLIKGVESLYPLKTREGLFCCLIKLRLE